MDSIVSEKYSWTKDNQSFEYCRKSLNLSKAIGIFLCSIFFWKLESNGVHPRYKHIHEWIKSGSKYRERTWKNTNNGFEYRQNKGYYERESYTKWRCRGELHNERNINYEFFSLQEYRFRPRKQSIWKIQILIWQLNSVHHNTSMNSQSEPIWIDRSDIDEVLADLTREAQTTISWLVQHARKISLLLAKEREHIEFLYRTIYLPNKEFFDEFIDASSESWYNALVDLVWWLTEAFVYKAYGFEDKRTTMIRYDSSYFHIKRRNNINLEAWSSLWWIAPDEPQVAPPRVLQLFRSIRQRISFLGRISSNKLEGSFPWYQVTPLWRQIAEWYMKNNVFSFLTSD